MKRILVYNSGGGLGDSIQIIPLMLSLKNHFRKSKILYLGAHENHFKGKLKVYIDVETFDLNLKYFDLDGAHVFCQKKIKKKK